MTPLPANPTVIVLIGDDDTVKSVATNVDRELNLQVTRSERIFAELSLGQPFQKSLAE